MPKIDSHLGFTFRVGPQETNQYARIDVTVSGIDTSIDVMTQLEESHEALNKVWAFVRGEVDKEIESILDGDK